MSDTEATPEPASDAAPTPGRRGAQVLGAAIVAVFALGPFVGFLQINRTQIADPGSILTYAVATTALALAVWALVCWRTALAPDRTGVAVAAVLLAFFNYGTIFDTNPQTTGRLVLVLALWMLLAAGAAVIAYALAGHTNVAVGMLLFGSVLLLVPLAGYFSYRAEGDPAPEASGTIPDLVVPEERPNVYWFLLDGYPRADQLEHQLDIDNTPFLDGLEQRSFTVSSSSATSYARTHLSVSSTLEMDYPVVPGTDLPNAFARLSRVVIGDNTTVRRFHAMGYTYAYSEAGGSQWALCDPDLADVCLPTRQAGLPLDELDVTLLQLTPLGPLVDAQIPYTDPVWVARQVEARRGSTLREPFFVFSHILTPHWPFRYEQDCTVRTAPRLHHGLDDATLRQEYGNQVRCLNPLVLEGIDRIIEQDPTAIIIVQSDHGSDFELDWLDAPDEWSVEALDERFAAFSAIRMPERCADLPVDGQPLVNTFSLVFACIEGREPELLEYRAFLSPWEETEAMEEVDLSRFRSLDGDDEGGQPSG
jgi:hypothetical protein